MCNIYICYSRIYDSMIYEFRCLVWDLGAFPRGGINYAAGRSLRFFIRTAGPTVESLPADGKAGQLCFAGQNDRHSSD